MSENRSLFNESWHRVSTQRLRLRPSVSLRRQRFRGERWFVAQDGFTNTFFRFRPEAYDFIARLDGTKTVEEIWMGCLERSPESAPGQGEVVSMLAQLYQANLLAADTTADTIPVAGISMMYTSGCPKIQKRCCHSRGLPPAVAS